ncbi:hypothetical protein M406DRAFT_332001 [Cryphonectria parasitica EP155]|uniref:Uncharacterized protein n=1 Tax=Cryphonectria parasitica (strain ATCC 38755 / EP155) TaxID=660469 RepID=A0A9P4XYY9_CRYP1|nr:uncharacterized protein M406DRAFT_332001 [Cryphonectria parasitica EP155]KAF3763486.1 hypothetical protein M406DRAFT_332001 [Cryphonectria parasitica EP155]
MDEAVPSRWGDRSLIQKGEGEEGGQAERAVMVERLLKPTSDYESDGNNAAALQAARSQENAAIRKHADWDSPAGAICRAHQQAKIHLAISTPDLPPIPHEVLNINLAVCPFVPLAGLIILYALSLAAELMVTPAWRNQYIREVVPLLHKSVTKVRRRSWPGVGGGDGDQAPEEQAAKVKALDQWCLDHGVSELM